ncbi:hypothetical protein ACOI9H_01685 [Corynebacterium striatum]|uniref:hypothetical protein n=1 Tax=Corynebacterium striatum TaxID=43770 RepID=UPI003B5A2FB7
MDRFQLTLTDCEPVVVTRRITDVAVSEMEGARRGWGPMKDVAINYLLLGLHKAMRREHREITPEQYEDFRDALEDYQDLGDDATSPLDQESSAR